MLDRIWCHFFGHRPRRHTGEKTHFSAWTVCGRCDQLMTRGYYGWQRANAMEERRFERELAKRAAELVDPDSETDLGTDRVKLPWIRNEVGTD